MVDSMESVTELGAMISYACQEAEKLPGALISSGGVEAAAAFCLIISSAPRGLFLHHGKAPYCLYYGILVAVAIFGLFQASAGFWVSGDVVGRRAVGKTIMWVSIVPLVMVVALGGGLVILNVN
ncbi:hypothetical protein CFC21_050232 [Triticum aestivum]|uniref:Uncharacterized protein n=2 Tax=Triticum aestivum TaxID=4565 RepID=A0A3B6CD51_WHEAT|nr:hypothetical protein CFC21_050232 [Triticum aestivum]